MKALSELDLATVTGGKAAPSGTPTGKSDSQLLDTLQGIQSSLEDLGKRNNGPFCGNNALLFMTMAFALSRRSQFVVYGSNDRRGFSWRAW
jgi:hypothetical protein